MIGLSSTELEAVLGPTETANGVPSRFYTSNEAAGAERDSVLSDTWTCIGFAGALSPGHARPVELMGLPLMMLRDPEGVVRVFHNVCRHRGHRLVAEECRLAGAIRCPYHSWTYGYDGTLRGTPHIGGHGVHEIGSFDRTSHGLLAVRCDTWLDMVFVNLSGEAPALREHLAPLTARWGEFVGSDGFSELRPALADGCLALELRCNWKLAVENYCESYHLPWVHPGLNSYSRIEDHYNIVEDGWGAGQGTNVFAFSERSGFSLPAFPEWPEARLRVAEYIALFPNVLLGLQNDHFYALVLMPVSPDRTVESLQIYYVGDEPLGEQYREARRAMLEGWRSVFLEDVSVCEGMQQGRASPAFDGGAFSPALDVATHAFHKWVATRLPLAD